MWSSTCHVTNCMDSYRPEKLQHIHFCKIYLLCVTASIIIYADSLNPVFLTHGKWSWIKNLVTAIVTYLSGMMKCSRAQSSLREFCKGVPVTSNLWLDLNSSNVLYSRESVFFSLWASSTINSAQLTGWRNDYMKNIYGWLTVMHSNEIFNTQKHCSNSFKEILLFLCFILVLLLLNK